MMVLGLAHRLDIPLEFESQVAGAGAMSKAGHVKGGGSALRHGCCEKEEVMCGRSGGAVRGIVWEEKSWLMSTEFVVVKSSVKL